MQPSEWISLSVGLGGLMVGAWGMWLTYTARTSAFQQKLYEKQIDVALDLMTAVNAFASDVVPASQEPANAAGWAPRMNQAMDKIFAILLRNEVLLPNSVVAALHAFTAAAPRQWSTQHADVSAVLTAYVNLEREIRLMMGTDALTQRTMELLQTRPTRQGNINSG